MIKNEFENLVKEMVSPEEFQDIDFVFCYHPAIRDAQDIKALYNVGGIKLIREMIPAAKMIKKWEDDAEEVRGEIEDLEARRDELLENIEREKALYHPK
jgi:hypothetical protein